MSLSFGLRPGVSLGAATARVKEAADSVLPPSISTSFEGSAKVFQQSMSNLALLLFGQRDVKIEIEVAAQGRGPGKTPAHPPLISLELGEGRARYRCERG